MPENMPNLSDSSSENENMREDIIVQLFASDSEVDAMGHNGNETLNERPNTIRSAALTSVATNSQSGGPGKGKKQQKR